MSQTTLKAQRKKNYSSIPNELKLLSQWVCFKIQKMDGDTKTKKIPINPHTGKAANCSDPRTWATFEQALDALTKHGLGHIGFAFTKDDPYVGIDIDHCYEDDKFNEVATDILGKFHGTYVEFSVSGTGVHIITKGEKKAGKKNPKCGVEVYSASRFFVFTGNTINSNAMPIIDQKEQLESFYNQYIKTDEPQKQHTHQSQPLFLSDEDIIKKVQGASNGSKFTALYHGDISSHNNDNSSADLALCSILAFYTKDSDQIDRIFRSSGLMRDKWNRKDYREGTIHKAISGCSDSYGDRSRSSNRKIHTNSGEHMSDPAVEEEIACDSTKEEAQTTKDGTAEEHEKPQQEMKKNNKFFFQQLNKMLQKPTKIRWIIKNYLDVESLCVLFGEPGAMKSFVAIDIGLCAAFGIDWHGEKIREKGPVFYIAGEGHLGLSRRLQAWVQAHGTSVQDAPFFVSNQAAQILDASSAINVASAIEELQRNHGDPLLVIIDTLNRNFGNGDENSTEDMTTFINHIDAYIRNKFKCAVLIVHHSPLNNPGRARGASALRASLDWEFSLTKNGKRRDFAVTKVKEHDEPQKICFEPETIFLDGWIDEEDGTPMTSCVLRRTKAHDNADSNRGTDLSTPQNILLAALTKLLKEKDKVHIDDWRAEVYKEQIAPKANTLDAKRKAFKRTLDSLIELRLVEGIDDFWILKN